MKRALIILGVVLLILGIAAVLHPAYTYHKQEQVAKIGAFQATVEEEKTAQIPPVPPPPAPPSRSPPPLLGPTTKSSSAPAARLDSFRPAPSPAHLLGPSPGPRRRHPTPSP